MYKKISVFTPGDYLVDLMCHYVALNAASAANSWLSYCNNKVTYCAET